jgi:hypothetical protein
MANSLRLVLVLCSTLAVPLPPSPVHAAPWLPLGLGTRWEYRGVAGSHQVETITGFPVLHGRTVAAKSYSEGVDAGLENYWLLAPDGSVLLAGFNNPSAALAILYEPPIRLLPVPPVVGPGSFVTTTIFNLFTDAVLGTFPLRYDVSEEVQLTLPAGLFHTFGVGQAISLPSPQSVAGRTLSLDGRTIGRAGSSIFSVTTTDWFSEGVGEVQYLASDVYQLVSFGEPTATARSNWTAVKRLFH